MSMATEISLQKLPPQNLEAEQMVLGGVLVENASIDKVKAVLRTDDFYKTAHRKIWAAMLEMREQDLNIDLITLSDALRVVNAKEHGLGASYLAELVSLVPTAANIKHHAGIVVAMSQLRRITNACSDALTKAHNLQEPGKIATDLVALLNDTRRNDGIEVITQRDLVIFAMSETEKRYENKGILSGTPTGFRDLDMLLEGLHPEDLIIIAGRPSMGKSALAENISDNVAGFFLRKHEEAMKNLDPEAKAPALKRVGYISIEQGKQQLALRAISRLSGVSNTKIRRGELGGRDWDALGKGAGKGAVLPIVYVTEALDERSVDSTIDMLVQQYGCGIILVDYLQLMKSDEERGRNREQEVSGQSRMLKGKAKQHRLPVIALSQLNRALENRPLSDRRPVLADLRESGAIEQDADVILFVYREEVYRPCECPIDLDCGCGRRGKAEVIVAKQRQGPRGGVPMGWHGPTTSFRDAV